MMEGIEDEIDPVSAVRNLGRRPGSRAAFYTSGWAQPSPRRCC